MRKSALSIPMLNDWLLAIIVLILAALVSNAISEEPKQDIDDSQDLRRLLDSLLAGNVEACSVPDIDKVERGKNAKLPVSRWPAALEAVRKCMAKEFGDLTLKEDRRDKTGAAESQLFR